MSYSKINNENFKGTVHLRKQRWSSIRKLGSRVVSSYLCDAKGREDIFGLDTMEGSCNISVADAGVSYRIISMLIELYC